MSPAASAACCLALALLAAARIAAAPPVEIRETVPAPNGSIERLLRDGVLAEERFLDEDGALAEESFYVDGVLSEQRTYLRRAGRLVGVEIRDPAGAITATLSYRYDGAGRLVAAVETGGLGASGTGMIASDGGPQASWSKSETASIVTIYDARGRAAAVLSYSGDKLVAKDARSYGDGPLPTATLVEDLVAGTSSATEYDAQGRPVSRRETAAGKERSRSDFRYGPDGKLAEESSRSAGFLYSRRVAYDGSGALAREEFRANGLLAKVVVHKENGKIEELYRDGALFARVEYAGGRKVREEFFESGVPSRTKEYQ